MVYRAPKPNRAIPGMEDTPTTNVVENPVVLLFFGQSNSANHSITPYTPPSELGVYMSYNGLLYPASDPVYGATMDPKIPNNRGSIMCRTAARVASALNRKIVIIGAGCSGFRTIDWVNNAYGAYSFMEEQINMLYTNHSLKPTLAIWHQGESDALDNATGVQVFNNMTTIFDRVRQDVSPDIKFLVHVASIVKGLPKNEKVRLGQLAILHTRSDCYFASDTDTIGLYGRRDKTHWNGNGVSTVSERLALSILKIIG